MKEWIDKIELMSWVFLGKGISALIVYFLGKRLLHCFLRFWKHCFKKANMEQGLAQFLLTLARAAGYVVLCLVIAGILGIHTSSIIALIGSAGFTVGLALQGSLSNFAGGVLILLMKPFRVGDEIIVSELEGTVVSIDIFYTRLLTTDHKMIVIPNGTLSNSNITNVTSQPNRRLTLTIAVAADQDLVEIKDFLKQIVVEQNIVAENEIEVILQKIEYAYLVLAIRLFVPTKQYFTIQYDLLEQIQIKLQEKGIHFATGSKKKLFFLEEK